MPQRKSRTKRRSSEANHFPSPGASSSGAASLGAANAGTANPAPASIGRVGPAGWSYPDWAGYVYPSRRAKGFHEATYLAEFFDTIEINLPFYQPWRPDHAAQWIDRVAANPRFVFTAKLWQRFTHDVRSVTSASTAADERAVRAGFDVLRAVNKLGAVLLQFPFSFHRTAETVAYLSAVLKRFADYPLVVEVRHGSWGSPETLELLRTSGVSFCNIDQPIIGRSLGPSAQATSAVGYVRLHWLRYDTLFSREATSNPQEHNNYNLRFQELARGGNHIHKASRRVRQM